MQTMRAAHLLLALLGLSAAIGSRATPPSADAANKLLLSFVSELQQFAEAGGRRRLQTLSTVNALIDRQQERMEVGASWVGW